MSDRREPWLKGVEGLPDRLAERARQNGLKSLSDDDELELDAAVAKSARGIRRARENFEARTGCPVEVEPPTLPPPIDDVRSPL